nr:MAG TPA: hypothetical protein [Caudoviricetes sp.]
MSVHKDIFYCLFNIGYKESLLHINSYTIRILVINSQSL